MPLKHSGVRVASAAVTKTCCVVVSCHTPKKNSTACFFSLHFDSFLAGVGVLGGFGLLLAPDVVLAGVLGGFGLLVEPGVVLVGGFRPELV